MIEDEEREPGPPLDAENRTGGTPLSSLKYAQGPEDDECAMEEPRPVRERPRNIEIRPLDHGYLVRVGCQELAIESVDKLVDRLGEYLRDPHSTEVAYQNGQLL